MTPDEMMKEGDKLYNQGSPGGAREWYIGAFGKLKIMKDHRIELLEERIAQLVPAGHVVVPIDPPAELLNSMGMRHRHDFGLLDPERQEGIRRSMRQLHEEVVGTGFYRAGWALSIFTDNDDPGDPPLPASSGPEQPGCVCAGINATEPTCGQEFRQLATVTAISFCGNRVNDHACGHRRECHEVRP